MEVYRLSDRRSETYAGHAMALLTRTALLLLGLRHTDCKRKSQTDRHQTDALRSSNSILWTRSA